MNVNESIDYNDLREKSKKIIPERSDEIMTIAEKLKKEGMKEGMKEGKREELIETVVTLLENKFNQKLSDELIKTIKNADTEDLVTIRNNIFDIESIDEVKKIIK